MASFAIDASDARACDAPARRIEMSQLPLFHVVAFSAHRRIADEAGVAGAIRAALKELRRESPGEWIAQCSVGCPLGSDSRERRTRLEEGDRSQQSPPQIPVS